MIDQIFCVIEIFYYILVESYELDTEMKLTRSICS